MLGLGLKLLGFGKDFFLKYWKIILPVVLITTAFLWTKNYYYNLGQLEERSSWTHKIEVETKKNAELSLKLDNALKAFSLLALKEDKVRVEKETVHEQTIKTIVNSNPVYKECKVEESVLAEQNAIKALGPKKP